MEFRPFRSTPSLGLFLRVLSLIFQFASGDALLATGQRLKIITGGDQDMVDEAHKVIENQRAYAKRHGYSFEVHVGNYAYPWTAYWHKIAALLREIRAPQALADVVIWMDLDVIITNPAQKMLEWILSEHSKSAVLLTEDPQRGSGLPFVGRAKRIVNTGIILVRRRPEAHLLLDKLFMYGRRHDNAAYQPQSTNTLHEQDAFNWLLGGPLGGLLGRHAAVLPQRHNHLNLNTFARNFYDMKFKDPSSSEWTLGDFTSHCSGLSLQMREWCVDDSLAAAEHVTSNAEDSTLEVRSQLGLEVAAGNASNITNLTVGKPTRVLAPLSV
jgi:hypothetical protein